MNKLRRWFTITLLLLVGCNLNTGPSPTVAPTAPPQIASANPTAPPQKSPLSPTAAPTKTAAPPSPELQLHVTTSSDWTTVRLVKGAIVNGHRIVSASPGADVASFDQDTLQLTQPLAQADAHQSVEMVVDLSLYNELGSADLLLEIDRGHLGATTVEVYSYACGGPGPVASLTWDGIQPSGANTQQFTVHAAQLTLGPKNEYIVIAQLNFWYYGPGISGGFENDRGERNTALDPLLGKTYAAADPAVVSQQIEWAVEYGVDAFSIEWTTPRGEGCCGSMEDTLDDVFLKSPNIGEVRWAIFYDFPLRLRQTAGLEQYGDAFDFDQPAVYSTLVEDFRRFAKKYFGNPQYLTIDGRPVIYIWATNAFQGDLQGALRDARQAVAEEGYDVFIAGDEIIANQFDPNHARLFDAVTTFTFLIPGLPIQSWQDIGDAIPAVDQTFTQWQQNLQSLKVIDRQEKVNFQPAWAPQYDERLSKTNTSDPLYVPALSKDQVTAMAEMARKHAEPAGSQGQKLIWVNTWNCWAETTTIEPTANMGPKYPAGNYNFDMLEVVRDVFGGETYGCGGP